MHVRRIVASAATALVLAGGGVVLSSSGAQAAPAACHTVIRVVPVTEFVAQQVWENGQWVTRYVPVTVYRQISTIVCD